MFKLEQKIKINPLKLDRYNVNKHRIRKRRWKRGLSHKINKITKS